MGCGKGHDQGILPDRDEVQPLAATRPAYKGRVQLTVPYGLEAVGRRGTRQFDGDVRGTLRQRSQDVFEAGPEADTGADTQDGLPLGAVVGHGVEARALGCQDGPGVRQERGAPGGEGDLACGAVEQVQSEFALQAPDLLADGGLDDVQTLGGPAEVQFLGDRHEVPQLTQLHYLPPATRIHHDP